MTELQYTATDVVEALIREYLKLKNLTNTLEAFDKERPRGEGGIRRSDVLRKVLGLEKLAALVKKQNPEMPLPPALQMWAEHSMKKLNPRDGGAPAVATNPPVPMPLAPTPSNGVAQAQAVAAQEQRASSPAASTAQSQEPTAYMQRVNAQHTTSRGPASARPNSAPVKHSPGQIAVAESLVIEDIDDEPVGGPAAASAPATIPNRTTGTKVDRGAQLSPEQSKQLRHQVWGTMNQPPPSWKQGFFFCDRPGLGFGLVQKAGGPCGVLAGVQAHILAVLYNGPATTPQSPRQPRNGLTGMCGCMSTDAVVVEEPPKEPPFGEHFTLNPSNLQQQAALVRAVTTSLWTAGNGHSAQFLASSHGSTTSLSYEGLTRSLVLYDASSQEELKHLVAARLPQLMEQDGFGLVLFVLSLVLTRGLAQIAKDMDVAENCLMGAHGYCGQEMVNLIISGTASSNVFDGNQTIDGGTMLKGVPKRGKLGLLTLFEWYKYVEVGRFYKEPELPIWVVQSESHFTVLFAADGRAAHGALPFNLYYYDGLANQEEIIKLTISVSPTGGWTAKMGSSLGDRGKSDGENIPPLECVVETRWPGVAVDWNGADPIL